MMMLIRWQSKRPFLGLVLQLFYLILFILFFIQIVMIRALLKYILLISSNISTCLVLLSASGVLCDILHE